MREEYTKLITPLLSEAKHWATAVSPLIENGFSFQQILIREEVLHELDLLDAMLDLPLVEFKTAFRARCEARQFNTSECIAIAVNPETETNKLYLAIARLVLSESDLKALFPRRSPFLDKNKKIDLVAGCPPKLIERLSRQVEISNAALLVNLLVGVSIESYNALISCIFHNKLKINISTSYLADKIEFSLLSTDTERCSSLFLSMMALDKDNVNPVYAFSLRPIYGVLLRRIPSETLLSVMPTISSMNFAIHLMRLISDFLPLSLSDAGVRYLRALPASIQKAVFLSSMDGFFREYLPPAPMAELIKYIQSYPLEEQAQLFARLIFCARNSPVEFAADIMQAFPKGNFIGDITNPVPVIGSVLEQSLSPRNKLFLEAILRYLCEHTPWDRLCVNGISRVTVLHLACLSVHCVELFRVICEYLPKPDIYRMALSTDSLGRVPLHGVMDPSIIIQTLHCIPLALRLSFLLDKLGEFMGGWNIPWMSRVNLSFSHRKQAANLRAEMPFCIAVLSLLSKQDAFQLMRANPYVRDQLVVLVLSPGYDNFLQLEDIQSSALIDLFEVLSKRYFAVNIVGPSIRDITITHLLAHPSLDAFVNALRVMLKKELMNERNSLLNLTSKTMSHFLKMSYHEDAIDSLLKLIIEISSSSLKSSEKYLRLCALIRHYDVLMSAQPQALTVQSQASHKKVVLWEIIIEAIDVIWNKLIGLHWADDRCAHYVDKITGLKEIVTTPILPEIFDQYFLGLKNLHPDHYKDSLALFPENPALIFACFIYTCQVLGKAAALEFLSQSYEGKSLRDYAEEASTDALKAKLATCVSDEYVELVYLTKTRERVIQSLGRGLPPQSSPMFFQPRLAEPHSEPPPRQNTFGPS